MPTDTVYCRIELLMIFCSVLNLCVRFFLSLLSTFGFLAPSSTSEVGVYISTTSTGIAGFP